MRQLARETPAAISLDEKVGEIILLTKGELFQPRPADMEPLPSWRVELEIRWNHASSWIILLAAVGIIILAMIIFPKYRAFFRFLFVPLQNVKINNINRKT